MLQRFAIGPDGLSARDVQVRQISDALFFIAGAFFLPGFFLLLTHYFDRLLRRFRDS